MNPSITTLFANDTPETRYHDSENILRQLNGLNLPHQARVLDFGCGSGLMSLDLAQTMPEAHILGLDCVPEQIERAQSNLTHSKTSRRLANLSFELGDLEHATLGQRNFDLVLTLQVLQFCPDAAEAIKRFYASLAPNGIFLATTFVLPETQQELARCYHEQAIPFTPTWHTAAAWQTLLKTTGFVDVTIKTRTLSSHSLPPRHQAIRLEFQEHTDLKGVDLDELITLGLLMARRNG